MFNMKDRLFKGNAPPDYKLLIFTRVPIVDFHTIKRSMKVCILSSGAESSQQVIHQFPDNLKIQVLGATGIFPEIVWITVHRAPQLPINQLSR